MTQSPSGRYKAAASLVALSGVGFSGQTGGVGNVQPAGWNPSLPSGHSSELHDPPADINDSEWDVIPGPSNRPPVRQTQTPAVREGRNQGREIEAEISVRRAPSPKKKATNAAAVALINRMTAANAAKKRTAYIRSQADDVFVSMDDSAPPAAVQELQAVHNFAYTGTAAFFLASEKEPIRSRLIHDIFVFEYSNWATECGEIVLGRLLSTPYEAHPRAAVATFHTTQKQFKSNALTVDSEESWQEIISMLLQWKESGCWVVRIDLKMRFDRVAKAALNLVPKAEIISLDSDEEVSYTNARHAPATTALIAVSPAIKKAIAKGTVTQKRLEEEGEFMKMDALAKSHVTRICDAHKCERDLCRRNAFPCIPFDDIHVKVTQEQLASWSRNIEKHNASYSTPHPSLMENLRQQAERRRDKLTDKGKGKKASRKNSSDSSSGSHRARKRSKSTHSDHIDMFGLPPQLPAPYYHYPTAAAAFHAQSAYGHSAPLRSSHTRSSPVHYPEDLECTVLGYMQYCGERDSSRKTAWVTAGEVLEQNDITFEQLAILSGEELRAVGVSLGIQKDLKTRLKAYIRKQKKLAEEAAEEAADKAAAAADIKE